MVKGGEEGGRVGDGREGGGGVLGERDDGFARQGRRRAVASVNFSFTGHRSPPPPASSQVYNATDAASPFFYYEVRRSKLRGKIRWNFELTTLCS